MREFGLIRRRLIGIEPESLSEIDRLRSEAELREAIAVPLVALALVTGVRVHGIPATVGLVAAGLTLAALLFGQARLRRREAGDALVDALVIRRVEAPVVDRFEAVVAAELSRQEHRFPKTNATEPTRRLGPGVVDGQSSKSCRAERRLHSPYIPGPIARPESPAIRAISAVPSRRQ